MREGQTLRTEQTGWACSTTRVSRSG